VARVNELVHQIVADELERIGDERLELVTVMRVEVDPDLRHATVWVDTPEGGERDKDVLVALREQRTHLQAAIGRQARLKRTPELAFQPDDVERTAARVEDILRTLHPDEVDTADEDSERAGGQDRGSGSGAGG
jgi:ribosome-binding factor A